MTVRDQPLALERKTERAEHAQSHALSQKVAGLLLAAGTIVMIGIITGEALYPAR